MNKQGKEDHTGEWTALLALAMVGIIMLVLLYVQEGLTYVNLVPAIVSGLLFIPAVWLAVQVRRTGAYLLTLPLLLSSLMAVVISFSGAPIIEQLSKRLSALEEHTLDTRIGTIENSSDALSKEMGSIRLTVHDRWFKGERLATWTADLLPKSLNSAGEIIPNTGPQDICFISALNSGHHGEGGRQFVKMIQPQNEGPWKIIVLHSNDAADFIHAQVMCIRLPNPGRLAVVNDTGEAG